MTQNGPDYLSPEITLSVFTNFFSLNLPILFEGNAEIALDLEWIDLNLKSGQHLRVNFPDRGVGPDEGSSSIESYGLYLHLLENWF